MAYAWPNPTRFYEVPTCSSVCYEYGMALEARGEGEDPVESGGDDNEDEVWIRIALLLFFLVKFL